MNVGVKTFGPPCIFEHYFSLKILAVKTSSVKLFPSSQCCKRSAKSVSFSVKYEYDCSDISIFIIDFSIAHANLNFLYDIDNNAKNWQKLNNYFVRPYKHNHIIKGLKE